jgi:hypothetical protein
MARRRRRTGRRKVEVAAMERAMDGDGDGVALEFRRTARVGYMRAQIFSFYIFPVFFSFSQIFSFYSYSISFLLFFLLLSLFFSVQNKACSWDFRLGISDVSFAVASING